MRNFVLAVVLSAVCALPTRAEESCSMQLERIAVVPFDTDETEHIFVPVVLNGRSTRFMLDTGAFWSGIHEDLATSLKLKDRTSPYLILVDASGTKIDRMVTVPGMKIGDAVFDTPIDLFVDHAPPERTIEQEGGVVGLNLLTHMDLEIDYAAKTISLFSQKHCEGAGVHWADEEVALKYTRAKPDIPMGTHIRRKTSEDQIDFPIVGAELEGELVRTLFDTGSTVTSIDLDHAKRRFGIGPGSPGVEPAGVAYLPSGKTVDLYSYTFKTLTISGITFENVPVHLGKFDESDLILGMHELKYLHLYFAFKDGIVHITGADAKHAQ